jgi:hypothetical protein
MTDQEELKPCPFCGGTPKLVHRMLCSHPFIVICTNKIAPEIDCQAQLWPSLRRHEAITVWNTRADQPPVVSPCMTATEVLERSSEMSLLLGATYGRLQSELLTPMIKRAYAILRRRGDVPDLAREALEKK